ncbi:MAG: epoxyqueuosine reductase [Clostridiaceae bacterium]|nr:epoxyqueuosine reductase [Clostridiaceae bacterium]
MHYYDQQIEGFIKKVVKDTLSNQEDFLFGFADLSDFLSSAYDLNPYAIVIGKRLEDDIVNKITSKPTNEYSEHYLDVNDELSYIASQISCQLIKNSIRTLIIPPTVSSPWIKNQMEVEGRIRYDFSHKLAATRAGLGWIGKTDLLITYKFGPRVRLISILVDHPLYTKNKPVIESQCGRCNICVKVCPANASNGTMWSVSVDRDEFFDPIKCWEYSQTLSNNINLGEGNKSVCGRCVAVCPQGRK